MKVLVITPDYPPSLGGIQVLVHRLVTNWPEDEIKVVTIQADSRNRATRPRFRFRLGLPHRVRVAILNGRALLTSFVFAPDVVLSAHVVASPAALAIRALRRTPYIQYVYARELSHHRWL